MLCKEYRGLLFTLRMMAILGFFIVCVPLKAMEQPEVLESKAMAEHLLSLKTSCYLNTSFLGNVSKVRQEMIKDDFKEVDFLSEDGLTINGLMREVTDPKVKIVYCSGFFPGTKEGISTFFPLFKNCMQPEDATILFFDARGHGKSQGRFLTAIGSYGQDEYKDVIGAMDLLQEKNPEVPIMVHGICAGGFHAARALIMLQKEGKIAQYPIAGLVFDSSFSSVMQMIYIPGTHMQNKVLPGMLSSWCSGKINKKDIQKSLCYKAALLPLAATIAVASWLVSFALQSQDPQTRITDDIKEVSCPILCIHSVDDSYVPYVVVQDLVAKARQAYMWEIEKEVSEHTCHHLKLTEAYQGNVRAFINACVQKKIQGPLNGWQFGDDDEPDVVLQAGFTTSLGNERFSRTLGRYSHSEQPDVIKMHYSLSEEAGI